MGSRRPRPWPGTPRTADAVNLCMLPRGLRRAGGPQTPHCLSNNVTTPGPRGRCKERGLLRGWRHPFLKMELGQLRMWLLGGNPRWQPGIRRSWKTGEGLFPGGSCLAEPRGSAETRLLLVKTPRLSLAPELSGGRPKAGSPRIAHRLSLCAGACRAQPALSEPARDQGVDN